MKSAPIVPAELAWRDGLPCSDLYQDSYHPPHGALPQAAHVFLGGNGLPERWCGRERFVVLETGFGLGNNFLATWQAWRQDPQACGRLHFISIERHPLRRGELQAVHQDKALEAPLRPLADALIAQWPPLTHNLHRLVFEGGRVQLLLALGDVQAWLPELLTQVDAFYLDGFAPDRNPEMWQGAVIKALARLAQPGAGAATWSSARLVRQGLADHGFEVHKVPGQGGKWSNTVARYQPAYLPRRAHRRPHGPQGDGRHALILGGGLAGCSAAWALAEQGWTSTVHDRLAAPAQATSGNPAGLFHGIVTADDAAHARFNRAAALEAQRVIGQALREQQVPGALDGLLRLAPAEPGVPLAEHLAGMQALLDRQGLPADYVRVLDPNQASALAGLPQQHPAWFYPGGGWVQPAALAQAFLDKAGTASRFQGHSAVHALRREGAGWQLLDAAGQVIDQAEVLVLANAGAALPLLGNPDWPLQQLRGQLSLLPADRLAAQGGRAPLRPLAGRGYLLPAVNGWVSFGATSQPDDSDPQVREADHRHNLGHWARLGARALDESDWLPHLAGRTGWRCSSHDRLPVVGAVPSLAGMTGVAGAGGGSGGPLQAREVLREAGLHLFIGLGSRGITWCALGAQVLAAGITGAPCPVEASLLDALDPARFQVKRARREGAGREGLGQARRVASRPAD